MPIKIGKQLTQLKSNLIEKGFALSYKLHLQISIYFILRTSDVKDLNYLCKHLL